METIDFFKNYCRDCVDRHYYISAPQIVLRSFYVMEIQRPKEITIRMFDWLLSVADKEIRTYKSQLKPTTHENNN